MAVQKSDKIKSSDMKKGSRVKIKKSSGLYLLAPDILGTMLEDPRDDYVEMGFEPGLSRARVDFDNNVRGGVFDINDLELVE